MQFHKCAICGKIVAMVKEGVPDTICCGKPMTKLIPNTSDGAGEKHVYGLSLNAAIRRFNAGNQC